MIFIWIILFILALWIAAFIGVAIAIGVVYIGTIIKEPTIDNLYAIRGKII